MTKLINGLMIAGMVLSWAIYYAISKVMVAWTGSPALAGLLLRGAALGFLTAQLLAEDAFSRLWHQGKAVVLLCVIGVFGFLLDLFANIGYQGGSLAAGTALLKTDVLMVNLVTVALYHRKLYATDWAGTFIMLAGVLLVLGVDLRGVHFRLRDGFFLLSAGCVTVNAFLIKTAQDRYHEDADMISYYNNAVVLGLFAVMAAIQGKPLTYDVPPNFWWFVTLGGLAQTGIYFFYYRNLKRCEVWVVKLYLLLMPIVSAIIGAVFLGEELTAARIVGIGVVLAGAAVILLRDKLHRKAPEGA